MVTIDAVRAVAHGLPRSYEVIVRGRVKFRVGQIVWLAFSPDETMMGLAFPKEERDWLIGGAPDKFMLPDRSDLRFNWVHARLAALDEAEMHDLVLDAWRMVVPKRVASAHAVDPRSARRLAATGGRRRAECSHPLDDGWQDDAGRLPRVLLNQLL